METLRKLKNVKQPPRDEKLEKEYQDIAALSAQQVLENCASAPEGLSGRTPPGAFRSMAGTPLPIIKRSLGIISFYSPSRMSLSLCCCSLALSR